MTIRPAGPGDAVAILNVHREAILAKAAEHYPAATLEAWGAGATPERVARQERQIADPEFLVLVAETGGDTVGFAIAVPSREELRALYVKPNGAGRVGRVLLAELERRAFRTAKALNCDASLNAVPFYRANGYAEKGRAEHILSSGVSVPCVRMSKARPAAMPNR